jgi:hypothetical protein
LIIWKKKEKQPLSYFSFPKSGNLNLTSIPFAISIVYYRSLNPLLYFTGEGRILFEDGSICRYWSLISYCKQSKGKEKR